MNRPLFYSSFPLLYVLIANAVSINIYALGAAIVTPVGPRGFQEAEGSGLSWRKKNHSFFRGVANQVFCQAFRLIIYSILQSLSAARESPG
jgi:hypothetical protein